MMPPEEIASAVAYALSRPADVALENITLKSLTGNRMIGLPILSSAAVGASL